MPTKSRTHPTYINEPVTETCCPEASRCESDPDHVICEEHMPELYLYHERAADHCDTDSCREACGECADNAAYDAGVR